MILNKKDFLEENSKYKVLYMPPKINNLNLKEKTLGGGRPIETDIPPTGTGS